MQSIYLHIKIHFFAFLQDYSGGDDEDNSAPPPSMAPPPLPQDYGGGTAGGWNSASVTTAAPPAQDDDWGWKPEEPQNSTTAGPRYGNLDDDLWSTNTGNDNNYNQVRTTNLVSYSFWNWI